MELVKKYLNKKGVDFDFDIVATSEWDIFANIAYDSIHHCNEEYKETITRDEKIKYLSNFTHSLSGKEPIDNNKLLSLEEEIIDKLFVSYKRNNNLGSIVNVNGKELIRKTKDKRVDLITYSFPCQDLSVAGSIHGFNKGMEEGSETRSSLLWQIGRILDELNSISKLPRFLLLENVKNMLSKKHLPQYEKWISKLKGLGYSTKTFIIDAKDYGVPQHRERVFAVSILNYNGKTNEKGEILDINNFDLKGDILKNKTLLDIIQEDYHIPKIRWEAELAWANDTPSRQKMFNRNFVLNSNLDDAKKYSRTVTTRQDRFPNAGVVDLKNAINKGMIRQYRLHSNPYFETKIYRKKKSNFRLITPREAYMLMGFEYEDFDNVYYRNFNKNYKPIFRREKLYQQAGNSIVINAITPIMNLIGEFWCNEKNR